MGLTVDTTDQSIVPRRRDEDSGRFERIYDEQSVNDVLSGTRLATSEVADALGCHRTTAHALLVQLEDEGMVESSEAGGTCIWEMADE